MTITRPELPGTLTPGMPVWVRRSSSDMRGRTGRERYIEARIVTAARVWVTIERADVPAAALGYQTWRMRRDTQNEGNDRYSQYNASFLTEAQYRYERRLHNARTYLDEQGIRVERGPWKDREIELSDALRRGIGAQ